MKYFLLLFLSFCSLLFANSSSKAAEKVNLKFEEMIIPLNINQLSQLEKYSDDSTELIDWFKSNRFIKVFELSKYLNFPVFKEEGLNREVLRSWLGRKILSQLSKTIVVPNDNNGVEVFNTIENLLEDNNEVSTLEIIKALPSEEILLDIDNLILIISSWKEELLMQQNLTLRLNSLSKTQPKVFKLNKIRYDSELIKSNQKIYTRHRSAPLNVELWKTNKTP